MLGIERPEREPAGTRPAEIAPPEIAPPETKPARPNKASPPLAVPPPVWLAGSSARASSTCARASRAGMEASSNSSLRSWSQVASSWGCFLLDGATSGSGGEAAASAAAMAQNRSQMSRMSRGGLAVGWSRSRNTDAWRRHRVRCSHPWAVYSHSLIGCSHPLPPGWHAPDPAPSPPEPSAPTPATRHAPCGPCLSVSQQDEPPAPAPFPAANALACVCAAAASKCVSRAARSPGERGASTVDASRRRSAHHEGAGDGGVAGETGPKPTERPRPAESHPAGMRQGGPPCGIPPPAPAMSVWESARVVSAASTAAPPTLQASAAPPVITAPLAATASVAATAAAAAPRAASSSSVALASAIISTTLANPSSCGCRLPAPPASHSTPLSHSTKSSRLRSPASTPAGRGCPAAASPKIAANGDSNRTGHAHPSS
eukprot:scaffold12137_cov79-Isochrysis_galbana.AAC.2